MAATDTIVTYPDRPVDGIACIELRSRAATFGYESLNDEVEALSASSLIIQYELSMPVIKLLNITDFLLSDVGEVSAGDLAGPLLNYLGSLSADDAVYSPEVIVDRALGRASPYVADRFSHLPVALDRAFRFIDAIGGVGNGSFLRRPWVHNSLDFASLVPLAKDAEGRGVPSERMPLHALWWQQGVTSAAERLFRSSYRGDGIADESSQVLVPLPFKRIDGTSSSPSAPGSRTIASVGPKEEPVGFSLAASSDMHPGGPDADVVRLALDATAAFIDSRHAVTPDG